MTGLFYGCLSNCDIKRSCHALAYSVFLSHVIIMCFSTDKTIWQHVDYHTLSPGWNCSQGFSYASLPANAYILPARSFPFSVGSRDLYTHSSTRPHGEVRNLSTGTTLLSAFCSKNFFASLHPTSVAQTTHHRMVGLVNNELERARKEEVMA
jgi:hypothetical protein